MYSTDLIKSILNQFADLIADTSLEQLNAIPKGFNNNIAWNYGHVVASSYGLAFVSSGVNPSANLQLGSKFRKGTRPESPVTEEEMNELKKWADGFPGLLEDSIKEGKFENIISYTTQTFRLPMDTLESILSTIAAHDTLHFQTARMYKRILNT